MKYRVRKVRENGENLFYIDKEIDSGSMFKRNKWVPVLMNCWEYGLSDRAYNTIEGAKNYINSQIDTTKVVKA